MREQIYTVQDAAEYLNLSTVTLAKWRQEGVGPQFVRLGRRVVYRKGDLDDFVQRHLVAPSN